MPHCLPGLAGGPPARPPTGPRGAADRRDFGPCDHSRRVASEHDGTAGESASSADGAEGGPPVEKTQGGGRAMVQALNVPTNARRGFGFSVLFTLVVVGIFVIDPGATTRSAYYYVALGFVLATTLGMLATAVLTGVSAYRLSRDL